MFCKNLLQRSVPCQQKRKLSVAPTSSAIFFCLLKTTLRNRKNILPLATGSFGRWEWFASEGARAHHVGMAWIFVAKV